MSGGATRPIFFLALVALTTQHILSAAVAPEPPAFRTKFDQQIVPGQPVLVSTRVEKGPVIDGEVDRDPVWPNCGRTHGAWAQIGRHQESGRQTVVYSCYDMENLYFAFVSEEPELQNVRMDGAVSGTGATRAGPDDCVEVVMEVGGTQGEGQTYSFRANSRAQSTNWGFMVIPPNQGYYTPVWKSAGKFGPNRWMVEMAIPFATIKKRPAQKGLSTPARGDVFGLKLVRWGAEQQDPNDRLVSTWNTDIACPLLCVMGGNGLLYFEDSNALRDSGLALPQAQSPWKREGDIQPFPEGGLSLAKGAVMSQTAEARPNSFYILSVEGEGLMEVLVSGRKLELKDGRGGFWTGEKQDKVEVAVRALGAAKVRKVAMQYEPGEEPAGTYCLTNNYRHPDRNIRTLLRDVPDGSYRYVHLDYKNAVLCDDNPAIAPQYYRGSGHDFNTRMEDLGGKEGWIPFSKGSLTGRPEIVLWNCVTVPEPQYTYGIHTHSVEIDLGQDYYVRGLDVLCAGPYYKALEVWGKEKAEDEWTYLYANDGQFVEPSKRRTDYHGYESVRGLDSVVRYLRWQFQPKGSAEGEGYRGSVCIDGIQEFWVWGEPKGERAEIKPFQPWIADEGAAPVKWTTTAPDPDACQIVPRPRKMEKEEGWFVIGPGTKIVAQPDAEARKVARQIQDEIRERWQMDVPVTEETPETGVGQDDMIYLGQPMAGAMAERLRKEDGLEVDQKKPQAYALRASRQRVTVLGRDDEGLYWGVQSLMMAMRWHSSKDPKQNGLGVRCMRVEDWPATLDRSLLYPEWSCFVGVESEIPRLVRNFHLQTRFKWNATYSDIEGMRGEVANSWPAGRVAEVCRHVREQYHMELRPMLPRCPVSCCCAWAEISRAARDANLVERDPDEDPEELAKLKSINLCPLNPKTYDLIFARIDELQRQYGWPGKMWLEGLVLHAPENGSRWAICRTCQKSGKSRDELYALFAERIAEHLRERKIRGVLESYNVAWGDRDDPKWRRALVVADVKSLPGDFEYILPDGASPRLREFVRAAVDPSRTANGPPDWPSGERIHRIDCPNDFRTMVASVESGLASEIESMWYGPDARRAGGIDLDDLNVWLYGWHFGRDLPSWRAGDRPAFFPIDIRPFANHSGHPTGKERLEPGRVPAIDLRYVPTGKQVLSGVEFDIIDPAKNNGKSLLMLGRPLPGATHPMDAATVSEGTEPIPVGRKLASLAFLRASWQASSQTFAPQDLWLFPTCRVIYDDDAWLAVDCFRVQADDFWDRPWQGAMVDRNRIGWMGNCPGGSGVMLRVHEWVNPYPSKTVKSLQFFTPGYEDTNARKRSSPDCQAFVAITGVEPIQQDYSYWSKRADRPPLLPPLKKPAQEGAILQRAGDVQGGDREYSIGLKGPGGEVRSRLELSAVARWFPSYTLSPNDCGQVACNTEFKPFGFVQTLEPAVRLCRVEIRGPLYSGAGYDRALSYSLGRNHRLDVTVEISEDSQSWRKAGELKGVSGDADFLPVEFAPTLAKKLRFTATAEPYHEDYNPGMADSREPYDQPYFVWRLFAPTDKAGR